jgi:2',3'-cyclic-nucleotide 2'-phosphodiesterase (5'-nucleotidase family)/predicted AlkP superfamily phosphohydrolase/phosphomutase
MKKKILYILVMLAFLLGAITPALRAQATGEPQGSGNSKVIFFVADGARQDLMKEHFVGNLPAKYQDEFIYGAMADGNGLLTQAPANTGAGWYSLMTGAWSGVHGSTNNTFHKNGGSGTDFQSKRTAAFDAGVLQAETLAQAAERAGKKVMQFEFAGGRNGAIQGPTVDYRNFFSGRGVTTNFISPTDDAAFVTSFGLQFDHPAGFAGQAAFAEAAPAPAVGWTNTPTTYSPAYQMRMRVLDSGTDKYGLNAFIYDPSDDGVVNYEMVMFSPDKDGAHAVADVPKGYMAETKVKIVGGAYDGKTAGFIFKVEELTTDLSKVRLFHSSVTRAIATWPTWPGEPGFTDFEEYLAATYPVSTGADYAVLEAGIVSEETYVDQGLYWAEFAYRALEYLLENFTWDIVMVGYPVTDEFQHQFLGLVTEKLPNGQPNPAYDDITLDGVKDNRVTEREGFLKVAYHQAAETWWIVRQEVPGNVDSFVSSDHGFGAQFLAIDASKVLVDLGLLSKPQTSNCRTASGETIGSTKACWAGGTVQVYLNVAGRDPAPASGSTIKQIAAKDVDATVQKIKDAFAALSDPNDWTGDAAPEGWKMIDRMYTKAQARYIPNGPDTTADMAHPTRTGDLVVFAYPPYQFDAATPGALVSLSHFFGQHGYVPDVQVMDANVNMRAAFLAAGPDIVPNSVTTARTIDVAPTISALMGIPMPQQAQGRPLTEILSPLTSMKKVNLLAYTDFHGQLVPTTITMDGISTVSVGGAAYLATMFDEYEADLPGEDILVSDGDSVGASPPESSLLEDKPTIDVLNAWGVGLTTLGNHEFDFGLQRLWDQQAQANFDYLAANVVEKATGLIPSWLKASEVYTINGVQVGVIGAALEVTPEMVKPANVETLTFLPAAPAVIAESQRLADLGVKVQVLVVHEGSAVGQNPVGNVAGIAWEGPILTLANDIQASSIDLMTGGHTHRPTNTMVGHILVLEASNAGKDFMVAQLLVGADDVVWAGGANILAKNLGVAARPDVAAIVKKASDDTAPLRNQIIGSQQFDILRDPTRLNESAMGNMIADAQRWYYPEVEAAIINSGGLRQDIKCDPPSGGEASCQITWGEAYAVLPFGNTTVIETLTGDQLKTALMNGFSPKCDTAISTGRFPQVSGLKIKFHCDTAAKKPVIDGIWKTPNGVGGSEIAVGPADTIRIITNDFMQSGGDGYTILTKGTDIKYTGDLLLDVAIAYIKQFSPVGPVVDGRVLFDSTNTSPNPNPGQWRMFLPFAGQRK